MSGLQGVWHVQCLLGRDLVDTDSGIKPHLRLTPQTKSGFLKEKLLKNVCRDKMGLRPCSASLRAPQSSNNTESVRKLVSPVFFIKARSSCQQMGQGRSSWAQEGRQRYALEGRARSDGTEPDPGHGGQPTLPLALSEAPVPRGEEIGTRTPAHLTTPPHPLTQSG